MKKKAIKKLTIIVDREGLPYESVYDYCDYKQDQMLEALEMAEKDGHKVIVEELKPASRDYQKEYKYHSEENPYVKQPLSFNDFKLFFDQLMDIQDDPDYYHKLNLNGTREQFLCNKLGY